MRSAFLAALLGVSLVGLLAYVAFAGPSVSWRLSMHGWIALALGSILSVALAAGLMALMFHSARQGYDDRVRDLPDTSDAADKDHG